MSGFGTKKAALEDISPHRLLEVINTQTEIARLGIDLGTVMAVVAERSQKLTGADGAVIELAEGDDMVYRASSGIAQNQLGLRLKRSGSISGLCVAAGKPLRCEDSETDPRVDREACRRVGLRSLIVTPLMHGETVVGALKVLSRNAGAFGDEDAYVLDLLSGMVAAAMFHAAQQETNELVYRATHDPLTGLANRALFFDRLRDQIERARREERRFAVLNLDMDGLKPINDRFGHKAGDAALLAVAGRVKSESRRSDTVARMGGDEFAILLGTGQPADVQSLSQRLEEAIEAPFEYEENPLILGASIGHAVFPDDGTEPDRLLDCADQAMYRVKRERRPR
jgi:diguanylate cyclase (GGDEF)-like protein